MPLNEISGVSGFGASRQGQPLADTNARATPATNAAATPAAPTFSANAITQLRRADAPEKQDTQRSLMLQSQSLALARQEEVRLQQKLAKLRESIVESENRLREMQASEMSPRTH